MFHLINIDDIPHNEKQNFYEVFLAYDKNGSKMLEKNEFKNFIEDLGHKTNE